MEQTTHNMATVRKTPVRKSFVERYDLPAGGVSWIRDFGDFTEGTATRPAEGRWIVLVYAIWSCQDVQIVNEAVQAALATYGRVHLGIQRWSGELAIKHLWNESRMLHSDQWFPPFWFLVDNGRIESERFGRPPERLTDWYCSVS